MTISIKITKNNINIRLFYEKYNKQECELIKDIYKYNNNILLEFITSFNHLEYCQLYNIKYLIKYLIDNSDFFNFETKYYDILKNSCLFIKQEEERKEEETKQEEERKEEEMKQFKQKMEQYKIIAEKLQEEKKKEEEIKRRKMEEKHKTVQITKDNIDIEKLKEMGYNDVLIQDVLNPSEEGTSYYFSK